MVKYKEEKIKLTLEGSEFEVLQIANVDEVMDALIALPASDINKADERIPYWTEIWPSALALTRFIVLNQDRLAQKLILEVGAGLGLPSLAAAAYTRHVVCSDYLQDALVFAQKNALLNKIDTIDYRCIDWRNYTEGEKFDIILASDIAYEKRFFKDLPGSLKKMMHPHSEVWLSEPGRQFTAPFIDSLHHEFSIKSYPLPQTWRGTTFQTSVHVLKQKP